MSALLLTQCAFTGVHTRCPVERGRSFASKAGKNLTGPNMLIRRYNCTNSASRTHKLKIVAEGAMKEGELVRAFLIFFKLMEAAKAQRIAFQAMLKPVIDNLTPTSSAGHFFSLKHS